MRDTNKKQQKKKDQIRVEELLSLLPDELVSGFVSQTQANKHVKHLSGLLFIKLLLYGVLKSNKLSTHMLEYFYNSEHFSHLSGKGAHQTRHSSIADRLKRIPPELFSKLFAHVSAQVQAQFPAAKSGIAYSIKSFDSTMVAASAALLQEGMQVGRKSKTGAGKKQLKFSICLSNGLPCQASLSATQTYLSEDVALGELLLSTNQQDKTVLVFDRGVSKRATYEQLTENKHLFVTRLNPSAVYELVGERKLSKKETAGLWLQADLLVKLFGNKGACTQHSYRLIKAVSKESGEEIWFLSNMAHAPAAAITELYRQRWQIEVFFKFLKQHLGLEHLLSYEQKAIEIMLYVRLIAAMLILIYKQKNQLSSYKIAKEKFVAELEMQLIKQLIADCGGNPALLTQNIGLFKLW